MPSDFGGDPEVVMSRSAADSQAITHMTAIPLLTSPARV